MLDTLTDAGVTNSAIDVTAVDLGQVTPRQRAAGTQAAVWHFSKGMKLNPAGNDPVVTGLYNYLAGSANTGAPALRSAPPAADDLSSDDGGLPLAGLAIGGVIIAGLALLGGGGALFWFSRRKTEPSTAPPAE